LSFRPFTDTWILARPKVRYFGAYPAGFLLKARDLIGCGYGDSVLHVCAGRVRDYKCGPGCPGSNSVTHFHGQGEYDLTWDLDRSLKPDLIADDCESSAWGSIITAHPQIQGVLADPPYTDWYAQHYLVNTSGAQRPTPNSIVTNAINILPVGGRVGILSMEWPRYPKTRARQIAVVHVLVGNGNIGRTFAVYERTG